MAEAEDQITTTWARCGTRGATTEHHTIGRTVTIMAWAFRRAVALKEAVPRTARWEVQQERHPADRATWPCRHGNATCPRRQLLKHTWRTTCATCTANFRRCPSFLRSPSCRFQELEREQQVPFHREQQLPCTSSCRHRCGTTMDPVPRLYRIIRLPSDHHHRASTRRRATRSLLPGRMLAYPQCHRLASPSTAEQPMAVAMELAG